MARGARDEMDGFRVKGRALEVVFAQERRKTPNEMRGRSGAVSQGSRGDRRRGGDRGRGGPDFERSSSFERHRQRERREHRDGDRGGEPANEPAPPQDNRSGEEVE